MPRSKKSTIKFNPLEQIAIPGENNKINRQATSKQIETKKIAAKKKLGSSQNKKLPALNKKDLNVASPIEKAPAREMLIPISDSEQRDLNAIQTIKKWSKISSVCAVAPLPLLATLTSTSIQIKMIKDLCLIYKVPFHKELAKATLGSILGSGATLLSLGFLGKEVLKGVPYLGNALLVVTQPAAIYKLTYNLGSIFMRHFQNRGDLTNLNLNQTRALLKKN